MLPRASLAKPDLSARLNAKKPVTHIALSTHKDNLRVLSGIMRTFVFRLITKPNIAFDGAGASQTGTKDPEEQVGLRRRPSF